MKNRKRMAAIVLAALILGGCTAKPNSDDNKATGSDVGSSVVSQEGKEGVDLSVSKLKLDSEEYPSMDGSTACLPLMASVRSFVTGETLEEAENLTTCTTTPTSYEELINGNADILLVYEPAEVTKRDVIDSASVKLDFTPIGRDALVFIANESNPINNLTTYQLQDIYSGKITNWKDVGGEDKTIRAYQRSESSGSQSLFMKLLMKDISPMKAETEFSPGEMGELIENLAEYNNTGDALGYSVYYYAENMYKKPGLKMLSVDGVMPSNETLMDKSYTLYNDFYVVIREDAPQDSPERKLRDWLCTPQGREILIQAGYVPAD